MLDRVEVEMSAVIIAVTNEVPRIVSVRSSAYEARGCAHVDFLPFGPLDAKQDATLELATRRWVQETSGLELGYVEQLYTFGDLFRHADRLASGIRVLSVAYLALVQEHELQRTTQARWSDWYRFFPWEDWREGRPAVLSKEIVPAMAAWCDRGANTEERDGRRHRVDIAFGEGGVMWDEERVLERYELLYQACLVAEAARDAHSRVQLEGYRSDTPHENEGEERSRATIGQPMALDHRRILASAMGRLRAKLKYRPVVFELLPGVFTLYQLQRLVEALAGKRLHKQNFRRLVTRSGLVEGTGRVERQTGGRPAELFCFRRGVLRERPAPGVGLPGIRRQQGTS